MSYVDTMRETNEDVLDTAVDVVDAAAAVVPGMVRKGLQEYVDQQAFGLGRMVPDGWVDEAADAVIWAANEVFEECREALEQLRDVNRYLGSPEALRQVAEELGKVAQKAENIQITKSLMPGLMSWDDPPASRAYDLATDDQKDPLSRVTSTANDIASTIKQHADDIESYYVSLGLLIASAVGTIGGAVTAVLGACSSIATGPAGVAVAIIGIVVAVAGIAGLIISLLQLQQTSTQSTRSKLDGLPGKITEWKKPGFVQVQ